MIATLLGQRSFRPMKARSIPHHRSIVCQMLAECLQESVDDIGQSHKKNRYVSSTIGQNLIHDQ